MHGRPIAEEGLQLPPPGTEREGAIDDGSEMETLEGPGGTERTPVALDGSTKMVNQGHGYARADPGQQLSNRGTATSIPVLQAELDSLKAQKLEAVRGYDDSILKLEGALAILQRGS